MAISEYSYGTNGQAITITLASLASASARQSTVVDNRTTKHLDALLYMQIQTGATTPASDKAVRVYAYGTVNDGTDYTEGASGSDAAITMVSPTNLRLIGVISITAINTIYRAGPWSVGQAFGGILPAMWGIVVENATGGALNATSGNFKALYQGVELSIA